MLSRAERQAASVILLLIAGVAVTLVYLITNNTTRADADLSIRQTQIERGQALFAANCATCHGNKGQGLVGLPLNIDANHPKSEAAVTQREEYLSRTLHNGRPGTYMQAWGTENGGPLNTDQITSLVTMIMYGDWNQTAEVVASVYKGTPVAPPQSLSVYTGGVGGNPALATQGPFPSGVQNPTAAAGSAAAGTDMGAAGTPAANAAASGPATTSTINATEKDFAISLDTSVVKAGMVTINLTNQGPSPHNIGVVKGNGATKSGGLTDMGALVKDSETIEMGKKTSITVDLQPGTYQVVCTIPGHIQLGMILQITVK